jgi:hypothetical protein
VLSCQLKNFVKRVNCKNKEKRRKEVALAKIVAMLDGVAGHHIEEDPGRRGDRQSNNPIPKSTRE